MKENWEKKMTKKFLPFNPKDKDGVQRDLW